MKIGIDIQSTLKKPTGIGRYTLGLLEGLAKIDKENQYYLYCRKSFFSRRKKIPKFNVSNFHYKIDRLKRGLSNIIKNIDVLYTPSQHIVPCCDYKLISTIHDLVSYKFPENLSRDTVDKSRTAIPRCLKISDFIIVPSENTKKDIIEIFGEKFVDKIKVIYPGISSDFRLLPRREVIKVLKENSLEEDYLLFVGTIEPRKNVVNIIKALNVLKKKNLSPNKLVIIGNKGWGWEEVQKEIDVLNMESEIIFLNYVSSKLLPYFYNGARALLYPSIYEGFGFPIAEAISCGTPVITSKGSSCKEVADGSALLVNPDVPKEIADNICCIYNDENLYKELSKKGLERSKIFNWETTAGQFLEIFDKVV